MVRLRGHHLVCLFFFEGDLGETEYDLNRKRVIAKLEAGEPVAIVSGADDLCAHCPHLKGSQCVYKKGAQEEVVHLDKMAADCLGLSVGTITVWSETAQRVIHAPGKWFAQFCDRCDWLANCRIGSCP
jgi:uncharacterized protein